MLIDREKNRHPAASGNCGITGVIFQISEFFSAAHIIGSMNLRTALSVILLLMPGLAQAKDSLKLGYILYPPLVVSGESGELAGDVIDVIEQTLSGEFEIEWVKLPIGRVQWGLENGVIDAFSIYSYTSERESYALYPAKPILTIQSVLCSKLLAGKSFDSEAALLDELTGAAVISVLNSATFPYAGNDRILHLKIPYDDYSARGFSLLAESRADYMFFPIGSVYSDQIEENGLSCVNIGEARPVYIAFSNGNRNAARVEAQFKSVDILHF